MNDAGATFTPARLARYSNWAGLDINVLFSIPDACDK